MPHQPRPWMSLEEIRRERRELARAGQGGMREALTDQPVERRCLYCRGPLANGRAVCSDECDAGWWNVVPTIDGEVWTKELLLRDEGITVIDTVPALDITATATNSFREPVAPRGRATPWLQAYRAKLRQEAQARYEPIRAAAAARPDLTTYRQIAEHLGLTISVVSRALRGTGRPVSKGGAPPRNQNARRASG